MARRKHVSDIRKEQEASGASQADGYFAQQPVSQAEARVSGGKISSFPLSQIWPDRFQPRLIIPPDLRDRFFSGDINVYETAFEWIKRAKGEEAEEYRIEKLQQMGYTIEDQGQIKPATGTMVGRGEDLRVYLETGERRYWSLALNHAIKLMGGFNGPEPRLEVRIIQEPSRARQVIENIHAEEPTAVSRGREVASLVLAAMSIDPDPSETDYAYYRKAAEIQRIDGDIWESVMKIIPLQREILKRLLNLLRMPEEALILADKYEIPERALREVLQIPDSQQVEMVIRIIEEGYTSEDLQIIRQQPKRSQKTAAKPQSAAFKAASKVRSLYNFLIREGLSDQTSEIATEIAVKAEDDRDLFNLADALDSLAAQLRLRARH
jgi:hypothetical protein